MTHLTNYCDLHTHSTASDGTLTPTQLINLASELGLECIALTDHDTVAGIPEALEASKLKNIRLIPGIEFSIDCESLPIPDSADKSLHVLGYFDSSDIMKMETYQHNLIAARNKRNIEMLEKGKNAGIDITMEELRAFSSGDVITRGHFFKVLIDKGYAGDKKDAFQRFLAPGGIMYVRKEKLCPKEIIGMIKDNGGVPVFAHPALMKLDWETLENLIIVLKGYGLMGIEAHYVENKGDQTERLIDIANKNGLLITGGSDFHGAVKPHISLGTGLGDLRVPIELAEKLFKTLKRV